MPSAEGALRALLTAGSPNPVAAIIGVRAYNKRLSQNVTYPAIRYARISTPRDDTRTLDGREDYAKPRFQIDCYSVDDDVAIALSQAVRAHLVGFQGEVAGLRIDSIGTADEGGEVTENIGPDNSAVFGQRVDVIISHAE
jgi:Protein of unknown function (DUF3168)